MVSKARKDGTYNITYDDGDKEQGVAPTFIRDERGEPCSGVDPSDQEAVAAAFRKADRRSTGQVSRKAFSKAVLEG